MSSDNWISVKLSDIAEVKGGKRLPKGEQLVEYATAHPYIRVTDIDGRFINPSRLLYVPDEVFKSISRYIVKEGDIILSIVGTVGLIAIIGRNLNLASLTENCVKITDLKNCDGDFLYYYLISEFGQNQIKAKTVGSTQPKLPLYNINDIEISLPPLPTQRRIAAILTALDDKIELNRRMNATLEGIAQALWQEWFGKYAGEEEELPEGWRWGNVLEIAKLIGGGTPKTEIENYWDGDIPWISGKDITPNNRSVIIETEKSITREGLKNSSAKLLPPLSTVISARGTVGNFCLIPSEMTISQSNYALKSVVQNTDFFLFQQVANLVSEMQQKSYGTVFDTITTKTFSEIEIPIPPIEKMVEYNETIRPIFEKMIGNLHQSRTLTALRDALLPRLMRGEIDL